MGFSCAGFGCHTYFCFFSLDLFLLIDLNVPVNAAENLTPSSPQALRSSGKAKWKINSSPVTLQVCSGRK